MGQAKKRQLAEGRPNSAKRAGVLALGVVVVMALGLTGAYLANRETPSSEGAKLQGAAVSKGDSDFNLPDDDVHAGYAGSASCKDCHADAHAKWLTSDHHFAERLPLPEDRAAFDPLRSLTHGTQSSTARLDAEGLAEFITEGIEKEKRAYTIRRVIGHDPLRQFLVEGPGGRMQALEMAWDPHGSKWFNIYGDEDRKPGEWGHWTGRGMNWNAQCASCHNTRVQKNYDPESDSYQTRMAEMSIGCESCHGPMKSHVMWQTKTPAANTPDPTIKKQTRDQMLETCAACHARRGEITGDLVPGESFYDHFNLTVPDGSDIYYPDGQVRDENFEFAAFLGSKMHAAGVRCVDCHDPHSGKHVVQGNALCMQCHGAEGTRPDLKAPAPVIDPTAHSHHGESSPGNQCVSCHMPTTTYMQIHERHDHGFTIPDPQLTKDYGIPNACSRCHEEEGIDWVVEATERWYGPKMKRPTRERAILFARARLGDPASRTELVAFLGQPNEPLWQASACHLLAPWVYDPQVTTALLRQLKHPSPLVREAAARAVGILAMEHHSGVKAGLQPLLDDPVRSVRVAAAWMLRDTVDPESKAGVELLHMLKIGADQPVGQIQLGQYEFARKNLEAALDHFRKAVERDPHSAPFHHDLAVALNASGDVTGSIRALQEAIRLAPDMPDYHYKLALAWNEAGSLPNTVASLEKAVELEPNMARAWYNLSIAYSQSGRPSEALQAAKRAAELDPNNPEVEQLLRGLQQGN
jgi:Flp pilus assembly protein TadD